MNALGKLGVLAAIVSALLSNVGSTPAMTASYSPVANIAGALSAAPAVDNIQETRRALRMAREELETARRLAEVGQDLYGEPAFLTYLNALKPVLEAADQISQHLASLDVSTVFALAYGLAGARTALEADVSTLSNWLLLQQAVQPDARYVSPPARFVAVSAEPLLSDEDAMEHVDLTPPLLG